MLTIDVRFIANELVPGLQSGEYEIQDGKNVRDLLTLCEEKCGAPIPEKNYKFMYPLLNGRPITLDSALIESGTLHLCRVVTGG